MVAMETVSPLISLNLLTVLALLPKHLKNHVRSLGTGITTNVAGKFTICTGPAVTCTRTAIVDGLFR